MALPFRRARPIGLSLLLLLVLLLVICITQAKGASTGAVESDLGRDISAKEDTPHVAIAKSVKKELKQTEPVPPEVAKSPSAEQTVGISEKTLTQSEAGQTKQNLSTEPKESAESDRSAKKQNEEKPNTNPKEQTHTEESRFDAEMEIPDTIKTGFYLLLALSSGAVLFILVKVYRLRLSRAERRYGVQGDRTAQELTPLPSAVDDANSDDEDHTVFEVQRPPMRIL